MAYGIFDTLNKHNDICVMVSHAVVLEQLWPLAWLAESLTIEL